MSSISGLVVALDLGHSSVTEAWTFKHNSAIFAMDVSKDGATVIVSDLNGRVLLIDGDYGKQIAEVYSYKTDPSSFAADRHGHEAFARPDTLPNIGLDLHPSGRFFAVASHDRTTKFFETERGGAISVAVHNKMVRDVTFAPDGAIAYSYSDDGVIQSTRPFRSYENLRLAKIDRFFSLEDQNSLLLIDGDDRLMLWSQDAEPKLRPVLDIPENVSRMTQTTGGGNTFVATNRSRDLAYILEIDVQAGRMINKCGGLSLTDVLELGSEHKVQQISAGREPGVVFVLALDTADDRQKLYQLDVSACAGRRCWRNHEPTNIPPT